MMEVLKLEHFNFSSIISAGGSMENLSIEEVLSYAKPMVWKWISKLAKSIPREQQEEIEQEAYIRLLKKYPEIQSELGWKSLVYNHCRGAVLDYLKAGKGFQEDKAILKDSNGKKTFNRLSLHDVDDNDLSIDHILGKNGAFFEKNPDKIEINWELLARMSSEDPCLHAFVKYIRGITLDKMAPVFGVKIARAGQLVQAFVDRFDDPEYADCPWFKQCCFALGISEHLGMGLVDQSGERVGGLEFASLGWKLEPVDLESVTPAHYILEALSQTEMDFDG